MAKTYEVNDKKKIVKVVMEQISDKDFAIVQKYMAVGYQIISVKKLEEKAKVLRLNDTVIRAKLKDDAEGLAKYDKIVNTKVDGRKNTAGAKEWFMTNYPTEVSKEIKKQIDEYLSENPMKNGKTLDAVYKKYQEDQQRKAEKKEATQDEDIVVKNYSLDEYTRRFYWTYIYTRTEE